MQKAEVKDFLRGKRQTFVRKDSFYARFQTYFHWCLKTSASSIKGLLKDKGANEHCWIPPACSWASAAAWAGEGEWFCHVVQVFVKQLLYLTCGKTLFLGYPQAVRRLTLISAGAGDKVWVAYWGTCPGGIKGMCFLLVGNFLRATCQAFQQLIISGVYFLKCL